MTVVRRAKHFDVVERLHAVNLLNTSSMDTRRTFIRAVQVIRTCGRNRRVLVRICIVQGPHKTYAYDRNCEDQEKRVSKFSYSCSRYP